LEELVKIKDIEWIRLHYAYPHNSRKCAGSDENNLKYVVISISHFSI
jgi:tRNA A37 methylthiotransferase MiaB